MRRYQTSQPRYLVLVQTHPRFRGDRACTLGSSKHSSMAHRIPATLASFAKAVPAGSYRDLVRTGESASGGGVHIQAKLTRRNIGSVAIRENKGAGSRGRMGRGFSVPALTGEHIRQVVCPPRSRLFRG